MVDSKWESWEFFENERRVVPQDILDTRKRINTDGSTAAQKGGSRFSIAVLHSCA